MRSGRNFTYTLEQVAPPMEIFTFIQKHAGLTDYDMYETYNMGMDYAMFIPAKDTKKAMEAVREEGFDSILAGFITQGPRKVEIKPLSITFEAESLRLR
jgi:phosphoribosylaminoimidazole (AIR) synthetase